MRQYLQKSKIGRHHLFSKLSIHTVIFRANFDCSLHGQCVFLAADEQGLDKGQKSRQKDMDTTSLHAGTKMEHASQITKRDPVFEV